MVILPILVSCLLRVIYSARRQGLTLLGADVAEVHEEDRVGMEPIGD